MKPQKLPYDKFLESFKLAPRIAIDLWAKNEKGQVFYSKRQDEPFKGHWHIPGTFLLLGEAIDDCIKRVAMEEVGLNVGGSFKLLWLDEDMNEPRGHVVHLVYAIRVMGGEIKESENEQFFFEPPEPLIPSHRHIFLNI